MTSLLFVLALAAAFVAGTFSPFQPSLTFKPRKAGKVGKRGADRQPRRSKTTKAAAPAERQLSIVE